MMRCALRARAGMISEIYRKCLWLSGMGGEDASTGKTQNLIANDAQFFLQFAGLANNIVVAPIILIVAFTWLAFLIGPSFLAGLAVMIFTVPLQGMVRCAAPSTRRAPRRATPRGVGRHAHTQPPAPAVAVPRFWPVAAQTRLPVALLRRGASLRSLK
eukprot:2113335-Prymnesium_polylepis.1